MKAQTFILVIASLLVLGLQVVAEDKSRTYPPGAARSAIDSAVKKAASESKLVFLKAGHPQCGWCVVFDRYHHSDEVRQIIEKYYVVVAVDTVNMPDGEAQFSQVGAPSWVILTSDRKPVIDSYDHGANVGFPGRPKEGRRPHHRLRPEEPAGRGPGGVGAVCLHASPSSGADPPGGGGENHACHPSPHRLRREAAAEGQAAAFCHRSETVNATGG